MPAHRRRTIPATALDRYLTRRLRRTTGLEEVSVSAGYRLRAPDADGCNWSGDVVLRHGMRPPAAEVLQPALNTLLREARRRFNLSE